MLPLLSCCFDVFRIEFVGVTLNMSSCNSRKSFFFILCYHAFTFSFVICSPIPESQSPYDKFIYYLTSKNCSMPKELKLPFQELPDQPSFSKDKTLFSYLSAPLKECQTPNTLKEFDETNMLCTEVFDVLKNITCVRYNKSLSTIESGHLSENVCDDFESVKTILPTKDNYLSGRLTDKVICKVLCTAEKFELLCKTLLWSYDTLMKIKYALPSEADLQGNGNENIDKVSLPDEVISSAKPTSISVKPNSQNVKEPDRSKVSDSFHPDEEKSSNLNQTDQESHNVKISGDPSEIASQDSKKDPSNPQVEDETINKTGSTAKNIAVTIEQNNPVSESRNVSPEVSGNNVEATESKTSSNLNSQPEHIDDNINNIDVGEKLPQKGINENNPLENLDINNIATNITGLKDNQNSKNVTADNLLNNGNDKADSNVASKTNEKSSIPVVPATENDSDLNNGNFPQEEEKSKTEVANQAVKEIEKPKLMDYEGPNEVLPDSNPKFPESSTQLAIPDEEIDHQEDKSQENYDDIENENDYSKPSEYDNSLIPPSKNKESEAKSSNAVDSNQMGNGYGNDISSKTEIRRISTKNDPELFPQQEDNHFFFYFLSIVLIIMAGYLIFHNKQKIIALIVEGRHERRRRSHGAGYKKLETK